MSFTTSNILRKFRVPNAKLINFTSSPIRRDCAKVPNTCKEKVALLEPCCTVAVITGGAEGIGLSTAHQLLCNKANHVVMIGKDISKGLDAVNTLNCTHGKNKTTFIKCDVTNKDDVDDIFLKIKNEFKKVEIFVNCAGVWNENEWEEDLDTNLKGTIHVNQAVRHVFSKSTGIVINFSAVPGLHPFHISPIYAADNAAVIRFSQSSGHPLNFKRTGMRIVTLCTGITCTNYIKDVEERVPPEVKKDLKEYMHNSHGQKTDVCAKSVIELVKFAESGSVWLIEGSRLFLIQFPNWRKHTVLISQFT